MNHIHIYTDGGALGNPGPGGVGIIIKYDGGTERTKKITFGFKQTTNNRMELIAVIFALMMIEKDHGHIKTPITVYTDSNYVVSGFTQNWVDKWKEKNWTRNGKKPVANKDLWKKLDKYNSLFNIEFIWVKGHAGHYENEECDKMVKESAQGKHGKLHQDLGYKGK